MKSWSRKDFLKASLLGGGAALFARSSQLYGQGSPAIAAPGSANGDIRVAVVGIRGQGNGHIKTYVDDLKGSGVRLVALCDVDQEILDKRVDDVAKKGVKVAAYRDYRKLLEDKNIDAVVLATPNHWHSLQTIWALQAGKDVYVEKPLSHNIWEGRQAVEFAHHATDRIIQAGTQNRSSLDIPRAIEFVKSGQIGKITVARGLCYKLRESIGKTTGPQPIPSSVDYNLWTGPADLVPPHRNGPRGGPIHYDWHWFWNYGGGDITNQGIHQMDVARWFLGEAYPSSVMTYGGRFGIADDAETPNTEVTVMHYKTAPLVFEVRGMPMKPGMTAMDAFRGTRVGVVIHCEGGYVTVGENGTCMVYDNANKRIQSFTEQGLGSHRKNFVDAMKARKQSIANGQVENSHISSALCHLANVSYLVGAEKSNTDLVKAIKSDKQAMEVHERFVAHLKANNVDIESTKVVSGPLLKFDAKSETFKGQGSLSDKANSNLLVKRVGRAEFKIPEYKRQAVART